eukprot:gene12152-15265_t
MTNAAAAGSRSDSNAKTRNSVLHPECGRSLGVKTQIRFRHSALSALSVVDPKQRIHRRRELDDLDELLLL